MTDSRSISAETEKNVLLYLKSQQVLVGNVDVLVNNGKQSGRLQIRKGQPVTAACGKLTGNGALLTLAAIRNGNIQAEKSGQTVETNVSLSLSLVEQLLNKFPTFHQAAHSCDEEENLQQAIHLIHQFRRTEASAKLVEVLRSNRFYYPAWLWHSRLMTREDYIKKALAEARKWGNGDAAVQRETEKIEPQLSGAQEVVKRCIFCWSLIKTGEVRCKTCQGMLRVSDSVIPEGSSSVELVQTLRAYDLEFQAHPENARIAYCLSLGQFSLGNLERAREYINKALQLSQKEPIFIRTAALIAKMAVPAVKTAPAATQVTAPPRPAGPQKVILVVEDSQTSRKVISMLLGRKGYTIVEAKNGSEALQRSEEIVPDLVLLDVMLPDMTGYEVLSRLRQRGGLAEVPVIMLTGKNKPSDRLKGLFHGSNEYLTKPFDPAKLLAVIEKYLEQTAAVPATAPASTKNIEPAVPASAKPAAAAVVEAPPSSKKIELAAPVQVVQPVAVAGEIKPGNTDKMVLVVEDSPTSRKVISMVLAKRGYTIEEASTGGAALRKIAAVLPDLILLDAMLPDMTGYDILHRLKNDQRLKEVPVVMLTAKNNPVDRQKGLKGGSVAYLTKPFDPEKLLAVIDDNI